MNNIYLILPVKERILRGENTIKSRKMEMLLLPGSFFSAIISAGPDYAATIMAMNRINISIIVSFFIVLFCGLGPMLIAGCAGSGDNGSTATASTSATGGIIESAQLPQFDEECNTITDEGVSLESSTSLSPAYQVPPALQSRTTDFYDSANNAPIQQSKFGICLTCASCGMIGYSYYQNTNKISPLYTLIDAYLNPVIPPESSADPFYFWGHPNVALFCSFCESNGYALHTGNPPYPVDNLTYLYTANNNSKEYTTLPTTQDWQDTVSDYTASVQNGSINNTQFTGNYNQIIGPDSTQKSDKIKDALDKNNLVLIMFQIINTNKQGGLFGTGAYDRNTGVLSAATSSANPSNIWDLPSGRFYKGGQHWVYIFSYALSPTTGQTIFFIRNSWGIHINSNENGNYYMTSDFVDGSVTFNEKPCTLLLYGYALPIQ